MHVLPNLITSVATQALHNRNRDLSRSATPALLLVLLLGLLLLAWPWQLHAQRTLHLGNELRPWDGFSAFVLVDDRRLLVDALLKVVVEQNMIMPVSNDAKGCPPGSLRIAPVRDPSASTPSPYGRAGWPAPIRDPPSSCTVKAHMSPRCAPHQQGTTYNAKFSSSASTLRRSMPTALWADLFSPLASVNNHA